jgi:mxaL protein
LPYLRKAIAVATQHRDTSKLLVAFCLLLLALFQPAIPIKHSIYSYFMVIDITQSMNVVDMKINGKPASRLNYTKQMLRETIATMPCGTKVGLGMFSGVNVVTLYLPIDVCENFSSIQDTLDHIDWRSAWTADSRVRESMLSTARVVSNFTEPAQVIYFSDGEEAPKLHSFNTRDLSTLQSADGWLLVGIGSLQGAAIPKLSEKNQLLGYWSHESMQLAPGAAPIAAAGLLNRKNDLAEGMQDRYIAKLAEASMQSMAKEISATYVHGDSQQALYATMKKQKPARREWAPFDLSSSLALIAGLLLINCYLPWQKIKKMAKLIVKASPHIRPSAS